MKISIITVCYNSAQTIEKTILSVIQQSYKNIEFIIVDGKSTDETLFIISQYNEKITLISEKDEGLYFAINKGIEAATGDIIGILHSDDFYADNFVIEKIATCFNKEKCDALYGNLQYVKRINTDKVVRNWESKKYNTDLFYEGWMPPHPTFFVKKKCYENFGLYNTQLKFAADYELMLRFLMKNKVESYFINQVLVKMRIGGVSNNSIINRIKANLEDRKAWKINELTPHFFTFVKKPLSKIKQFFI